jgi:hypothetical protein
MTFRRSEVRFTQKIFISPFSSTNPSRRRPKTGTPSVKIQSKQAITQPTGCTPAFCIYPKEKITMAAAARAGINRLNAQSSTGPKTKKASPARVSTLSPMDSLRNPSCCLMKAPKNSS